MRRGTTPVIRIYPYNDIDLTDYVTIVVTIKSGAQTLNITGERLTLQDGYIEFRLTQEESLKLNYNGRMQVKAKAQDGTTIASSIMILDIDAILNEEVL